MLNPHNAKHYGRCLALNFIPLFWKGVVSIIFCFVGVASLQAGQLSLTWQDNSNNEEGFEIERCLQGENFGLLATVESGAESFVDDSVVPGHVYEYRVRAFNSFGYSGYTNVSSGTMPNTAPTLSEIEDVSVVKGTTSTVLDFQFADAESGSDELVFEAISSNLSVVPLSGIFVEVGEGSGTVSFASLGSSTGTSTITLLVSDGVDFAQQTFKVEVKRNLAPTVGMLQAANVQDSQQVGPIEFTISDAEYPEDLLTVIGTSMDESLIASESISIGGSGSNRTVSFATQAGVSGSTTIRLKVSDGVNSTNGVLSVNISKNSAPVISGLEEIYTIDEEGNIEALAFSISDRETAANSLEVSVSSSNALIVSQYGIKLKGSGSQRTLDITPSPGMTGTVELIVSVSDGVRTTRHAFNLRVLAPEQLVKILGFSIEQKLAVVEVENRLDATFSLWKIHSLDGAWEKVVDAQTVMEATSTTLIDPMPVDTAVCYRVIASE
ncbi:fibronectin type III domain-containing protein [Pelagicoccus sp. SDUM812002]|uniref:fibronectin type III domain-containing protein n=1 Tax=Pelagicoccus sp. SDUM812002 TaxID=3041266 RepID=UPI00280C8485|nr:fibronectin type III domain-containing protein [Pelagicoccus sp. SDUM812002]MDQ8188070.1 fibronectin type III domain-containing protein [Pelagicoccus sp. SDUM812002]